MAENDDDELDLSIFNDDFDDNNNNNDINLSIVKKLQQIWQNEKSSPELLPYDDIVIDNVKEHVNLQQRIVMRDAQSVEEQFELNLYRQEVNRVRFMLSSYLRCRLKKIEKFVLYILSNDQMIEQLSPDEYNYAVGYADLLEKHFMLSFLNNIPSNFRDINTISAEESMIQKPDLDAHVVVQVNEDIGPFAITEDDEVELSKDDILFARYRPFRKLLATHRVSLL